VSALAILQYKIHKVRKKKEVEEKQKKQMKEKNKNERQHIKTEIQFCILYIMSMFLFVRISSLPNIWFEPVLCVQS